MDKLTFHFSTSPVFNVIQPRNSEPRRLLLGFLLRLPARGTQDFAPHDNLDGEDLPDRT